jgi:hypothetical protein
LSEPSPDCEPGTPEDEDEVRVNGDWQAASGVAVAADRGRMRARERDGEWQELSGVVVGVRARGTVGRRPWAVDRRDAGTCGVGRAGVGERRES